MPRLAAPMRVAGAADALHAARDRRRRLDLDDEIDGAHVDAELERRGRDERRESGRPSAGPRSRFAAARASDPWCARTSGSPASSFSAPASRSAMRRLLTKISVERCARTSSSSRGWIARPDRRAHRALRRRPARDVRRLADARHVLDRDLDAQLELLLLRRVDDRDRAVGRRRVARSSRISSWIASRPSACSGLACRGRAASLSALRRRRARCAPPRNRATSSSGRCVADRPMRCSGAVRAQRLQPLQRQRQVGAALGRDERVDLVDDHRVDRAQRLAGVRGQQQVQRLGRGDQDVGRLALEARALGGGRVAGADRDRRRRGTRRRAPRRDCAMPASGARRLRSTSTASAFSGEM